MRSLIEQWLPAETVGAESRRERAVSSALPPINFLHVWWSRKPLTASRAAVVGGLLPAWPDDEEAAVDERARAVRDALRDEFGTEHGYHRWFIRILGILGDPAQAQRMIAEARRAGSKTATNAYGYERAFKHIPHAEEVAQVHRLAKLRTDVESPPVALDPFAGGGTIPFEMVRYGCRTLANELNPVAAAILEGTVRQPVLHARGLADDIARFGDQWAQRVRKSLEDCYAHDGPDERPAYIWAHTVPCPSTGFPTPLAPNFYLARGKAGRTVAVDVQGDAETGELTRSVIEGGAANNVGDRSTYNKGSGVSIWDAAATFDASYVHQQAQHGRLSQMLLAVSVTTPKVQGRRFRAPEQADLDAAVRAEAELDRRLPGWETRDLLPNEPIIDGSKTRELRQMGFTKWRDLFTPRQLLTLGTALEELHRTIADALEELGEERGKAIGLYLAIAMDKAVDYNSRLASWDSTRLKVRNSFDSRDFGIKWDFAEFDGSRSLLPWVVDQLVASVQGITRLAASEGEPLVRSWMAHPVEVTNSDASHLTWGERTVDLVVTDPPYYDNVMYGELSDYFYVWLKRSIRDIWPQFSEDLLAPKSEEVVANPAQHEDMATHSGRGKKPEGAKTASELANAEYDRHLTRCLKEICKCLKDDGVLVMMFNHKSVQAWDNLARALLEAGFQVASSWPVQTEPEKGLSQANKNAVSSAIFLACRKRGEREPGWWEDLRSEVSRTARDEARRLGELGLTGVNLTIATYGPVLAVLSRHWPVYTGRLTEEGHQEMLRPDAALDLAREEVADLKLRGLLGGRSVDFDRVTDYWLLAWYDFEAAKFPYDEARKLSLATHLELDELQRSHGLVRASSGMVELQSPAQRRTAGKLDPEAGTWQTLVDVLHSLLLVYEEDGFQAAQHWLQRHGYEDQEKLRELVRAAMHAVPRARDDDGELARPEARALERVRSTLFEDLPAPPEPGERTPPEQLDFSVGLMR